MRTTLAGCLMPHPVTVCVSTFGALYTTDLWAAYGLSSLYCGSGAVLRARRSSDGAELDIGRDGTAINTAALLAFVGGGNATVSIWYDQSGNGNHLVQADSTKQPLIVSSGSYLGKVTLDGVNDVMETAGTIPLTTKATVFSRMQAAVSAADLAAYYVAGDPYNLVDKGAGSDGRISAGSGAASVAFDGAGGYATYNIRASRWDRTQGTITAQIRNWVNSVEASPLFSSGLMAGNFNVNTLTLGATHAPSQFCPVSISELMVYTNALAPADIVAISNLL